MSDHGPVVTAPCYCCGSTRAQPAGRRWILPVLVEHVRCVDCGRTYDGDTGLPNGTSFAVWAACALAVVALGALAVASAPVAP